MQSGSSSRVEPGAVANAPERRLDVRAAGVHESFASGASCGKDGKALFEVAAKGLEMHTGDGLDGAAARGIEVPERDEMVGKWLPLVARPGGECRE